LLDRSEYLGNHHDKRIGKDANAEVLDAWVDFAALKQQARPKSDLITKHFKKLVKDNKDDSYSELLSDWDKHLSQPYDNAPSSALREYFSQLDADKAHKALLAQWQEYLKPTEKTPADWEYLPKPNQGYLVPIMTGYKAISPLYDNSDVANTRDSKTPVRFVEAVHSVGEWRGVNRLRSVGDFSACLWYYAPHKDNWYLCQQNKNSTDFDDESIADEVAVLVNSDDDF
jgi:CRISPR-associated protein Csy2